MSDEREDHRRLQLEANARAYANALREAQPKAEASQQHLDQMLTWAIGLMGAALFYLPNLLEQACPAGIHPRLVWIAVPWGLGILLALGGRVVGARHRDADSIAFYQKWHAIEGALLAGGLDLGCLGKRVLDIMNDRDENIAKHVARSKNLGRWTDCFYYCTHGAFALGVVAVLLGIARC
jgi:hypothetical protein